MNIPSIPRLAWGRMTILTSIIGDIQGRLISTLLYFTVVVPFGIISILATDPLMRKGENANPSWVKRDPVDNHLDSAMRQG